MTTKDCGSTKLLLIVGLLALLPVAAHANCCLLGINFDYRTGAFPLSRTPGLPLSEKCPSLYPFVRGIHNCTVYPLDPPSDPYVTTGLPCKTEGLDGVTTTYVVPTSVQVDLWGVCCNSAIPGNGPGPLDRCPLDPPGTPAI